jgi:hypothetical protein
MIRLILALMLLATPAMAQDPIGAARFDALVTGRTIAWGNDGQLFGEEQYLPGRRVKWRVPNGDCQLGSWWEESPGLICFGYDTGGAPACWRFYEQRGELQAQSAEDATGFLWSEISNSDKPLACAGPMIGV